MEEIHEFAFLRDLRGFVVDLLIFSDLDL